MFKYGLPLSNKLSFQSLWGSLEIHDWLSYSSFRGWKKKIALKIVRVSELAFNLLLLMLTLPPTWANICYLGLMFAADKKL